MSFEKGRKMKKNIFKYVFIIVALFFILNHSIAYGSISYFGGKFDAKNSYKTCSLTFKVNADSAYGYIQRAYRKLPFAYVKAVLDSACNDWNCISKYTGFTFTISSDSTTTRTIADDDIKFDRSRYASGVYFL